MLSGIVGLLPERVVARLGYSIGYLASYLVRGKRAMAERHMGRVRSHLGRDVSPQAVRRSARRMFGWYGRYWAEVFWVRARRFDRIVARTTLENVAVIAAARDSGNGVILALPHMGNWEAAGARAKTLGIPVLAVAEALPNRRIVDWFTEVRRRLGIEIVIARRGGRVREQLEKRLANGGTVALVADRDLSGRGIPVTLFGEETTIPGGPAVLACRTGATLLPAACYFEPRGRHDIVVGDPIVPDTSLPEKERPAAVAQELAAVFERLIANAPEQWHLLVPNWPSDREEAR
jgi:KDO2-lipid IV(A) lauroyltransferase